MDRVINAKQLRTSLAEVIRRVRKGERLTVLYRSRPAFQIIPPEAEDTLAHVPLEDDPLYGAGACGQFADGLTSRDHDAILYGKRSE